MILIDKIDVGNFEGAFRGLRNPLNSWRLSDSYIDKNNKFVLGEKDLDLAQRMIKGGPDESKFLRQIFISMDITAPIYWWKEMSTYKVGTTANSCSTMHKITANPITIGDFSFDKETKKLCLKSLQAMVGVCEQLRSDYLKTKNKLYWRALIQTLPMSYNQKRTWTANYAVLRNIYFARKNHKLTEWHSFCKMIEELPYGKELICYKGE